MQKIVFYIEIIAKKEYNRVVLGGDYMLLQFSVENYTSIRDEITLSLVAGSGAEHRDRLIKYKKERILPTAAIFGANAAGKTNIQRAMTAAIMFIRRSNELQINNPIPLMVPFLLDQKHRNEPSNFDFIFTVGDTKYQYGFSANSTAVFEEYLYKFSSSWKSMIFERTNIDHYEFTKANESELNKYKDKNTPNKLFLSTATSWNCELTREAYMWFAESIDTFDKFSFEDIDDIAKSGDSVKPFIKNLIGNADINIDDYFIETKRIEHKTMPSELIPLGINFPENATVFEEQVNITTVHKVENENGTEKYAMPFDSESEGTKRLFMFGPKLKRALENGSIMMVDEMDSSFHPLLLDYLIEIFNDKNINKNGAQLIFNTHSLNNLSLDYFRRDQIYFVEKDASGSTELYSLDEFSARTSDDIKKKYLQGRYGALPNIGFEGLL